MIRRVKAAALGLALLFGSGCGASAYAGARDVLNVVAQAADPAYAAAAAGCDAREDAIEHSAQSLPDYQARITIVRTRCASIVSAFEAVRHAHAAAWIAVDAAHNRRADWATAVRALGELQAAWAAVGVVLGAL